VKSGELEEGYFPLFVNRIPLIFPRYFQISLFFSSISYVFLIPEAEELSIFHLPPRLTFPIGFSLGEILAVFLLEGPSFQ